MAKTKSLAKVQKGKGQFQIRAPRRSLAFRCVAPTQRARASRRRVPNSKSEGVGGGGWGALCFLDCDGWHRKQFLFFIFYCLAPTHPLAFQYKTIWMRRSGAHPAAGGRYRGGAPPACHHTKFDAHLRLHYHTPHGLLFLPIRAAARSGDRSAS